MHVSAQKGFAMLIAVLALATVGVAISTTLLLLSISAAQASLAVQESAEAKTLANSCAELALQKLVATRTYIGTSGTTLMQGTCAYTISQLNLSDDTISATGTVNQTFRKVQVVVATSSLTIITWQEVGDLP